MAGLTGAGAGQGEAVGEGVAPGVRHGLLPPAPGHRGALWWRFDRARPALSSAAVGGGLVDVGWVLNVGVDRDYRRTDLAAHVGEVTDSLGVEGPGTALLTAAEVSRRTVAAEDGVQVWATTGVTRPTWPADRGALAGAGRRLPGTINVVALLPVPLSPSALVQAGLTVAEAKAQACVEFGLPGTGTASDALVVVGLPTPPGTAVEPFAGVRSWWGSRLALAVHAAVGAGLRGAP